jgi:hypothetical protein
MPAPVFTTTHSVHPLAPNFRGKHRTKPVPPIAHCFVANLYSSSCRRSSTLRSDNGKQMQSITAKRIISGLVLQ